MLQVGKVARSSSLLRVLREVGVAGERPATPEAAREFRQALEELGTTYVKLGQLLSSRPDLMPDVYIEELTRLVDEVPPVPFSDLEPVIRRSIGESAFASIDPEPLAAASIAQIHRALMTDGREVVVKVRRPGVLEQAKVDLDLLRSTADFLERRSGKAQILQVSALGEEVEQHLLGELDFTEEANNTELVGRMFADHPDLVVPQVIHPHVTEDVLVLEHIEGKRVGPDHGLDEERAAHLAREFFRAYRSRRRGCITPTPTAEMSSSPPTGASHSSTSASSGGSTRTRGCRSPSCCSPSRRTAATTSRP